MPTEEEESVKARQFFSKFPSGPMKNKRDYINAEFHVLESFEVLPNNETYRKMLISETKEMSSDLFPADDPIQPRLKRLLVRLENWGKEPPPLPSTPSPPSPTARTPRTAARLARRATRRAAPRVPLPNISNRAVIGSGSYGCVISPALPNQNNTGAWVEHPSNVTKLFYGSKDYKKSLKTSETAFNIMGRQPNHRSNTYTYKNWKLSDLPRSVRASCDTARHPGAPALVVRMPNLGVDVNNVLRKQSSKQKLVRVPQKTIIQECIRLIGDVHKIYTAGYIHGDIRETNVMVNLDTGHMAIVDFDWLMPIPDFLQRYMKHMGFYSNPPESILLKAIYRKRLDDNSYIMDKIYDWSGHYNYMWNELFGNKNVELLAFADELLDLRVGTQIQRLHDIVTPCFDSFGLAMTLLKMLDTVYQRPDAMMLQFKKDILQKMCDLHYDTRFTIEQAHERAQAFLGRL
jgi:hypothetical protein